MTTPGQRASAVTSVFLKLDDLRINREADDDFHNQDYFCCILCTKVQCLPIYLKYFLPVQVLMFLMRFPLIY